MQGSYSKRTSRISSPIAIITGSMAGGGSERVALRLAESLIEKGYEVDLLLISPAGEYRAEIFSQLSIYYFKSRPGPSGLLDYFQSRGIKAKRLAFNPLHEPFAWRMLKKRYPLCRISRFRVRRALAVSRYIHSRGPRMMLSLLHPPNMAAIYGCYLAKASFPLVISIRNNVEFATLQERSEIRNSYSSADAIVCVSHGIAESVIRNDDLPKAKVSVIYNPIPHRDILQMSQAEVFHPWFVDNEVPVIFTVGRIVPQKDHHTLISAFSLICKKRDAKLAIMSSNAENEANSLLAYAAKFGLSRKFEVLEFDPNPFRYMRRADCFVLSSKFEGLPNVLLEAMACGAPIVSTDAPYGPREILDNGKWGKLVALGNPEELASAILETLDGCRIGGGGEVMKRASFFSVERATNEYLSLMSGPSNEK